MPGFREILPGTKRYIQDRMETGKNSVAMKAATAITLFAIGVTGLGSLFEVYDGLTASDTTSNLTYDHPRMTPTLRSEIASDQAAEDNDMHEALDLFLATFGIEAAGMGFIELRHRQLSKPDRRPSGHELLGIHSVRYALFNNMGGAVNHIIWDSRRAVTRLNAGQDPYADARPEPPFDTPETPGPV